MYAQSPATPQPEQGFIRSWEQEIVFPSAVRFSVTLGLPPEQVTEVNLTLQPETRPAINIPLVLADTVVIGGEVTVVEYLWQIPPTDPPLIFRDITLTWAATTTDGQMARIQDTFTFNDERASWLQDVEVSNNLRVTLPNGAPSDSIATATRLGLGEFRNTLEQVTSLLNTNLGSIPNFRIIIYDDTLPICSENADGELVVLGYKTNMEVPCNPSAANNIFTDSGYTVLQVKSDSLGEIEQTISTYVVRQSHEQRWAGRDVPEWFKAGLTQFYTPTLKNELGAPLFTAARTNSLLPLDTMSQTAAEGTNFELWQSESYGLVVYIASQVGVDGLYRLANDAATASTFAEAYANTVGKSLNTLLDSFERWLFTDAAISAFAFTPYQAATPSPTPSRTPTTTRTPLPTTTPTPSLTPTVTGVLSRTPLPSNTPTRTPTEAPATNTPRPAGSLNTPTPEPPTSLAANVPNPSLTLGIAILVIGAILILITAVFLFRPKR
ncbi:MAG: hypothetical protein IT321_06960 [Anaerolineae bacterium]|nr:hypothetical protein [Anaerolineae bacterium]